MHRLIEEAHQQARATLSAHRAALDAIVTALLREESLNLEQIVALVEAVQRVLVVPGDHPQAMPVLDAVYVAAG